MSVTTAADVTVSDLLDAVISAPAVRLDAEFLRLVDALWDGGTLTALALPAVPLVLERLDRAGDDRKGHLLVLLGLLAEAEYPDTEGPVTAAVREGLDAYLALLGRCAKGEPLTLALLYLLSHLPGDRERVLAVAGGLGLDLDDLTRLDRCLQSLDPGDVVLGRVWPSPWEWSLSESERDFDRGWIGTLTSEQITATWRGDTRSVLAYTGAKAYWAVRHGRPTVVADTRGDDGGAATGAREVTTRHADAFRCPTCRGGLEFGADRVTCRACPAAYPVARGVLDFLSSADEAHDADDVLQNAAGMQGIGHYYENVLRPAFLRVMGSNWGGAVTPADEDAYLLDHTRLADGPLLDLAAGAGRWTAVVAEAAGAGRVVALDVITPMLTDLAARLPEVETVRASALRLPFGDATLGGVNCWNALQALPDPKAAIDEIGRCLRPGGVLTMLTFRWSPDPVYRYFQHAHSFPGSPDGIELFEPGQIRGWLDGAGLVVREESRPGTFVFVTAEKA
ncbi:class I SAM-dependent methyltransferase [Microbispora sp. ATCC PTA-5024]|uniref:class I SAM-dependent methyltransferase n=1 Tax=Microbispora sp. ATCC PTA-5024 TaxID=316330 RepID=UPI0003DBEE17|nr:class I SAM-dependent methyltransferase [Microbispora sp. ATCC PTA-5024]ETK37177.1 hypothetical protein MPTA5024_05245 [Microbispora sp. ATCC PTA-5024]